MQLGLFTHKGSGRSRPAHEVISFSPALAHGSQQIFGRKKGVLQEGHGALSLGLWTQLG